MHVAPEAAHAVEIPIPIAVDQIHPVGTSDHQRLVRQPLLHMGERMPEILAVEARRCSVSCIF